MKNFYRILASFALTIGLVFSVAPAITQAQTATVTAGRAEADTITSTSIVIIVKVSTTYLGTTVPGFAGNVKTTCTTVKTPVKTTTQDATKLSDGKYSAGCVRLDPLTEYSYKVFADNNAFTPITGSTTTTKAVTLRTTGDTFELKEGPTVSLTSKSGGGKDHKVDAKIYVNKPLPSIQYAVKLGIPNAAKSNCIISPALNSSDIRSVGGATTEDLNIYELHWDPVKAGSYCLGIEKQDAPYSSNYVTALGLVPGSMFSVTDTDVGAEPQPEPDGPNSYGCVSNGTSNYCMLAPIPIPDASGKIDTSGNIDVQQGLGNYIGGIIKLIMGIITVLAVLMIVVGGIEYMSTVSIGEKEGAKNRIVNALLGLLLALGSYIILNTINPDLVNIQVTIPSATLDLDLSQTAGDDGLGVGAADGELGSLKGDKNLSGKKIKGPSGTEVAACQPSTMTTIPIATLDQGMGIFTQSGGVQVSTSVKDSLIAGFIEYKKAVDAKPDLKKYKITSIAGYACRGAVGKKSVFSGHAFGVAIDINPGKNPFTKGAIITDLPTELVSALKSKGFGWGGEWKSAKDAMHFSKLSNERGSGTDSYKYVK